eukprot:XP_008666214.1 uncharacterized protein LOC103644836 [Zea mays]
MSYASLVSCEGATNALAPEGYRHFEAFDQSNEDFAAGVFLVEDDVLKCSVGALYDRMRGPHGRGVVQERADRALAQKVVVAVRILAYGIPADAIDEYVRIGESTAHEALKHFCTAIQTAFGPYYLRAPNAEDIARLLQVGESRGFPGMLGSVDCMHWEWRNCPSSWKGMFTGRGSCNDINVLHRSNLFERHLSGDTPPVSFTVNGHTYNMGYYLADEIYPDWPAFVKTIRNPYDVRTQHFATIQESARKDIERAFGVLQK